MIHLTEGANRAEWIWVFHIVDPNLCRDYGMIVAIVASFRSRYF